MIPKRTILVSASEFLYTKKRPEEEVMVCPDVLDALRKLRDAVEKEKGTFKINSVFRTWAKQQELFDLHKQDPVKYAVASAPGKSYHQAGRAIDFAIQELNFPGLPKDKWLEKFWSLYKPLGFSPIIDKPEMDASEAWHADFVGPWISAFHRLGYLETAKCAILDVGNWDDKETESNVKNMFIQAQLQRLGYDIGKADGVLGTKSLAALSKEKLSGNTDYIAQALSHR